MEQESKTPLPLTEIQEQVIQWHYELAGISPQSIATALTKASRAERERKRTAEAKALACLLLYNHKVGLISPTNTLENLNTVLTSKATDYALKRATGYIVEGEPTELMYKIYDYRQRLLESYDTTKK